MIASNLPRSADVELWLHRGEKRYELGQVGGHFAILAQPEAIIGGEAVVETIIDGQSDRFPVVINDGQSAESKRITFSRSLVQDPHTD